ncbi:MAG: glycosyltransferase [Clostridiales bacterium]|jgi:glycosyltransferase involved in cell wall biosynthesis|nr:glycosyltransferase [Clostridiales bacterium]
MKVFHVVTDKNVGGAGVSACSLLEFLNKSEIDLGLVVPSESFLLCFFRYKKVRIFEIENLSKSFDLISVFKFVCLFLKEKPDLIHTHACLSARIAARLLNIKIIYTRHWICDGCFCLFFKIINNFLCDAIIAVSNSTKKSLVDSGISEKKIKVIYNGIKKVNIHNSKNKKKLKKIYNLESIFTVGCVSRLEKIKNIDIFIRAAKLFVDKINSKTKFLIFGEGSQKEHLKNYTDKLNMNNNIVFMGFFKNLEEVYNLLDVYVLSSNQEALSLSLLEAMSAGCVCISTKCGGPEEIIKNKFNGLLVEKNNAYEIFLALKKVYNKALTRKKLSIHARNSINKRFSLEKMSEETLKLYNDILN